MSTFPGAFAVIEPLDTEAIIVFEVSHSTFKPSGEVIALIFASSPMRSDSVLEDNSTETFFTVTVQLVEYNFPAYEIVAVTVAFPGLIAVTLPSVTLTILLSEEDHETIKFCGSVFAERINVSVWYTVLFVSLSSIVTGFTETEQLAE